MYASAAKTDKENNSASSANSDSDKAESKKDDSKNEPVEGEFKEKK